MGISSNISPGSVLMAHSSNIGATIGTLMHPCSLGQQSTLFSSYHPSSASAAGRLTTHKPSPQADLTDPVFMRLPQGWYLALDGTLQPHSDPKHHDTTHYICLKKNLYGCKQAARNWFHFLKQGIVDAGFQQSKIDPCLYLWHDCLLVVYIDDRLIFVKDDTTIDTLFSSLGSIYN